MHHCIGSHIRAFLIHYLFAEIHAPDLVRTLAQKLTVDYLICREVTVVYGVVASVHQLAVAFLLPREESSLILFGTVFSVELAVSLVEVVVEGSGVVQRSAVVILAAVPFVFVLQEAAVIEQHIILGIERTLSGGISLAHITLVGYVTGLCLDPHLVLCQPQQHGVIAVCAQAAV